jgi:phosphopantetheine adenylyltransferase
MFKWLRNSVDKFNQVITEGNYRMPPMTWGRLITGIKPSLQLPATSEVAVGTTMIDTSKMLGEKFLWAFAVAALTVSALKWAAIGFGVVGIGVYTAEYIRAKKSRSDVIKEINFAGQRVEGTRADLYRLHNAQLRIMNISDTLGSSTSMTTADAIAKVLETVKEERTRVKVLDSGRYKASDTTYGFTEPDFRLLVDDVPEFEDKSAIKIDGLSLKPAWDSKRVSSEEMVERLALLEESLPADMQAKLKERLARSHPEVKPAAAAPQ